MPQSQRGMGGGSDTHLGISLGAMGGGEGTRKKAACMGVVTLCPSEPEKAVARGSRLVGLGRGGEKEKSGSGRKRIYFLLVMKRTFFVATSPSVPLDTWQFHATCSHHGPNHASDIGPTSPTASASGFGSRPCPGSVSQPASFCRPTCSAESLPERSSARWPARHATCVVNQHGGSPRCSDWPHHAGKKWSRGCGFQG